VSRPEFVYTTYIASSAEEVWEALTRGDFTRQYWFGRRIESDWTVGAPVMFFDGDTDVVTDRGEVLECDPPRRLSYTFHVEFIEALEREAPSRVTFDLDPLGQVVKLTITHDEFEPGSPTFEGIRAGWPAILSSLKSLLETGAPLAISKRYGEPVRPATREER
jgi:uncharacterized protein YndB with AHSA1/START domain